VFHANPDLHILSLGHSYTPAKPSRRQRQWAKKQQQSEFLNGSNSMSTQSSSPLLKHLYSGKGLYGATLLALRHPEGTKSLLEATEAMSIGKRGHFDQFLFHSTLHNLDIAFSDPPLGGWAEVSETLTSVGSGCRRNGGGWL